MSSFSSGTAEEQYIAERARSYGLDPQAVLAVAAHEGVTLPAEVGDQGTSFGPWQLHAGGALPQQIWQEGPAASRAWADSQAGIDYALRRMASVAAGQTGAQAVESIVYRFERPANPASEATAAIETYRQGGGPSTSPQLGKPLTGGLGSIPGLSWLGKTVNPNPAIMGANIGSDIAGGLGLGGIQSALTFPERAYNFLTSWRFVEVLGGFLLLLLGLYLLGRQFGINAPIPGVAAVGEKMAVRTAERQGERQAVRHYARRAAREDRTRELRRAEPSTQLGPDEDLPF